MKDNGFTLIELLAVIVILAIIFSIVTISVGKTINDSEKKLSTTQKNIIEHAAEMYYIEEGRNNKIACVSLNTLIDKGYLKANQVKDPQTKETMDGSVKITIDGKKYSYEYIEDFCGICKRVTKVTTGNVARGDFNYGDEYTCDVGDGENKIFFVIENSENNVSLIMNTNVGVDGKSVTPSSTNLSTVAWVSKEDYVASGGNVDSDGCCVFNDKGPVTATKALKEYTSTWTNLHPSQIKLPTYDQLYKAAGNIESNLPIWLYDYLDGTIHSVVDLCGYWLSSISPSGAAADVLFDGSFSGTNITSTENDGIRPVITLSKSDIQ